MSLVQLCETLVRVHWILLMPSLEKGSDPFFILLIYLGREMVSLLTAVSCCFLHLEGLKLRPFYSKGGIPGYPGLIALLSCICLTSISE